ncbi:unnamed protein product [Haemonchus placei]|uniref:Methyltransferase n=1 Tax=Haemonchus placei TaxID=6290 RepID=A0A0N4VZU7_HAEPC|nr:unnamed protein product [Haemonchus placei]
MAPPLPLMLVTKPIEKLLTLKCRLIKLDPKSAITNDMRDRGWEQFGRWKCPYPDMDKNLPEGTAGNIYRAMLANCKL